MSEIEARPQRPNIIENGPMTESIIGAEIAVETEKIATGKGGTKIRMIPSTSRQGANSMRTRKEKVTDVTNTRRINETKKIKRQGVKVPQQPRQRQRNNSVAELVSILGHIRDVQVW